MQSLDTNIPHFLRCIVCFKVPQIAISLDKIRIICKKCQKTKYKIIYRYQNSSAELFKFLLQNFKIKCSKCKLITVCQEYEKHKIICNSPTQLNYLYYEDDQHFQISKQFKGGLVQFFIMEREYYCLIKQQKQIQCSYCLRFMNIIQFHEHQHNCLKFRVEKNSQFGECLSHTINVLDIELEQYLTTRHLLEQQQQMVNIKENVFFENQQKLNNYYNLTYQLIYAVQILYIYLVFQGLI
ncbi:hypothetical protein pb186bvf_004217 [Paramecium bursaria]